MLLILLLLLAWAFGSARTLIRREHLQELAHLYALLCAYGAERQVGHLREVNDALLLRVEQPFTLLCDGHHQELGVLLEIDYQELVCLIGGHLALLWLEVAAKQEASAGCPDVRASQVLHAPQPYPNDWCLLEEWVLRQEREYAFFAI